MSEVVKGRFTIDLDRARSKLGKYQLADPYAYVLEFVQAAVLRGSHKLDIVVDSDDLKIVFDGQAFEREELHNIELAVLESCTTASQRSRQHMAMALLAAQSLNPSRIVIEGILGYRWEKRKNKASSLQELPVVAQNLIHVKMPWRLAAFLDHFRRRKDLREEEVLLLKQCAESSTNITLNGTNLKELAVRISSGDETSKVDIQGPELRGWGGLMPGRPAELTLIVNGVQVETLPLELGAIPFLAVVQSSQLRTDISGTSVQRDQAFEEVIKAVKEARGRSIAQLAQSEAQLYKQEITEELFSLSEFDTQANQDSYPGCFMKCPIWKLSDGRETTLAELQEIVDAVGYLPFSVERFLEESLDGLPGIIHCDVDLRDKLRNLTGWTTKNVTRRLRQQMEARENERAWRARRTHSNLMGTGYVKRAPIKLEGLKGEVGIKNRLEPPLLRVIVEQCLLCELSPKEWPSGVVACLEGPFEPLKTYDGVVHNTFSVNALIATAQVMRELYEELAQESEPQWEALLADFLRVASRAQPLRTLLEACHVPSDLSVDALKDHEWDLLNAEQESPLLEVAWVKTEGEKRLSVRELQAVQQAPTLVISESQQDTIKRLLGTDFLEPQSASQEKRVSFRLDSTVLREEKFLAALRTELSRVTQDLELRLGGFNLSRLVLVEGNPAEALSLQDSGAVHLHRNYPLIEAALRAEAPSPRVLCLLVSVLFTAINRASTQVTDAQEQELQKQLAEYLITAPARLADQDGGEPGGVMERICHSGVCSGWATDPAGLGLRLYFQEPAPDLAPDAVVPLDNPRKKGGHHFLYDLPKTARKGEKVLVHACLVHPTKGELVELSGSPRAYAEPHKLPAKPRGEVTEVTSEGVVRGWCVDPNAPLEAPQVEFYLDGNWKEGEWIGYCKAKLADPKLEEDVGFRGTHGFEFTIPNQYRDGYRHTLHVYGFDTDKTAGNPLLSGCPMTFVLAARESLGDQAWLRAKEAMESENYEEAIEHIRQRVELGGDSVPEDEVYSWLGAAYSALGRRGKANQAYERAIKLAPKQAEHWYFSGLVKAQLGHKHKALKQFRKAVLLDSDSVEARLELASRTPLTKEAIVHWNALLKQQDFKQTELAYRALLELHTQAGEVEKASAVLQQAQEAGLDNLPSLSSITASATRYARPAELPQEAERPDTAAREEARLFNQARMATRRGQAEEALRVLLGIRERDQFQGAPDELYSEIAMANYKLSRYAEALHYYREALKYKPNCERILCHIALVHQGAGDTLSTIETFQEAVDANPESPWPLMMMGAFLVKRKREDWAIKVLEKCLSLDDKGRYRRVNITLGRLYAAQGRMEDAQRCLQHAEMAGVGEVDLQRLRSELPTQTSAQ